MNNARGPLRRLDVLEQRQDLLGRPHRENRSLQHLETAGRAAIRRITLVDGALERDDVEAHLFVKELDQSDLRRIELGDAVTAFTELHQTTMADHVFQELEIREVLV